jgi:hypothetical protein
MRERIASEIKTRARAKMVATLAEQQDVCLKKAEARFKIQLEAQLQARLEVERS